jgi:hypothetical protein
LEPGVEEKVEALKALKVIEASTYNKYMLGEGYNEGLSLVEYEEYLRRTLETLHVMIPYAEGLGAVHTAQVWKEMAASYEEEIAKVKGGTSEPKIQNGRDLVLNLIEPVLHAVPSELFAER